MKHTPEFPPARFHRIRVPGTEGLERMVSSRSTHGLDTALALAFEIGDGLVVARFDMGSGVPEVQGLGVVIDIDAASRPVVEWVKVNVHLPAPNPSGRQFWQQPKPTFKFDKPVVARYRLRELFAQHFSDPFASSRQVASSSEVNRSSGAGRSGYVYLMKSPYGFKIGRSRRLKERTRLFGVKLPFEVELVHHTWFEDAPEAERRLHAQYAKKRCGGEWFLLDQVDVEQIRTFTMP